MGLGSRWDERGRAAMEGRRRVECGGPLWVGKDKGSCNWSKNNLSYTTLEQSSHYRPIATEGWGGVVPLLS